MSVCFNSQSKLQWASRQASFQAVVLDEDPSIINSISFKECRIKFYNFALKHSLSWLNQHDFYIKDKKIIEFNKRLLLSGSSLALCTIYKEKICDN